MMSLSFLVCIIKSGFCGIILFLSRKAIQHEILLFLISKYKHMFYGSLKEANMITVLFCIGPLDLVICMTVLNCGWEGGFLFPFC